MKNLITPILFFLIATLCYGQKAKISCASQTKLKKDISLGYLNFRGVQLGEIYILKISGNKIRDMRPIGKKIISEKNIDVSSAVPLKEYDTEMEFTLDASAEISPTLKAELANELSKGLSFKLFNSIVKIIINPGEEITYFDPNLFPISSKEYYALINRITVADSLIILTKSGLNIDASAKVKLGQYDLQIINNCNGLLRIKGKEVPVFFEFITYKPNITSVEKSVVGFRAGDTVKIKTAIWQQIMNFELADNFNN